MAGESLEEFLGESASPVVASPPQRVLSAGKAGPVHATHEPVERLEPEPETGNMEYKLKVGKRERPACCALAPPPRSAHLRRRHGRSAFRPHGLAVVRPRGRRCAAFTAGAP
jgi:hypothetical protein